MPGHEPQRSAPSNRPPQQPQATKRARPFGSSASSRYRVGGGGAEAQQRRRSGAGSCQGRTAGVGSEGGRQAGREALTVVLAVAPVTGHGDGSAGLVRAEVVLRALRSRPVVAAALRRSSGAFIGCRQLHAPRGHRRREGQRGGGGGEAPSGAPRSGPAGGGERREAEGRQRRAGNWLCSGEPLPLSPPRSPGLRLRHRRRRRCCCKSRHSLVTRSRRLAPAGAPAKRSEAAAVWPEHRAAQARRTTQEAAGGVGGPAGAWGLALPRLRAGPSAGSLRSCPWPAPRAGARLPACLPAPGAGKALPAGSDLGTPRRRAGPGRGAAHGEAWHARGSLRPGGGGQGGGGGRGQARTL
ncbi:uncharacterized protein LOC143844626 [Paroedura picta]|uniref:uncharacterized protein LOC143844626 n=1 Tax=Paroedura picta TaxID=143630 RepID=UPI004055C8B9